MTTFTLSSLPIRERGSKHADDANVPTYIVAPHPGARIETIAQADASRVWQVAPHPGARIETPKLTSR